MKYIISKPAVFTLFTLAVFTISFSCESFETKSETTENIPLDSTLMIPNFNITLMGDSTSFKQDDFSKEGLVLIKYFSPDCNHCQDEATLYVSKKDSLINIKTIWIAGNWNTMAMIEEFYKTYELEQLDPIAIGIETENQLLVHYGFEGIPYSAIFKDNQFVKDYVGDIDFEELIAMNNGTFVPEPKDSLSQK